MSKFARDSQGNKAITQVFNGNIIGSVNGNNYSDIMCVSGRNFTFDLGLDSQKVATARSIRVIALDEDGKELRNFTLPLESHIDINIVGGEDTVVGKIETHNASVSLSNVSTVDQINVSNGNCECRDSKIRGVTCTNGDVRLRKSPVTSMRVEKGQVVKY